MCEIFSKQTPAVFPSKIWSYFGFNYIDTQQGLCKVICKKSEVLLFIYMGVLYLPVLCHCVFITELSYCEKVNTPHMVYWIVRYFMVPSTPLETLAGVLQQ